MQGRPPTIRGFSMNRYLLALTGALTWSIGTPAWSECPTLPNQIVNGQPADATKVMADLDHLRDCLNGGQATVGVQPTFQILGQGGAITSVKAPATTASYDLNLPAGPGVAGQVLASAGAGQPMIWQSSSSTKQPMVDGYPVLRPIASAFSWTNQKDAFVVDHPNGPVTLMFSGTSSPQFSGIYQAPPTVGSYTLTVKIDSFGTYQSTSVGGAYIIDSTGKITFFGYSGGNLAIGRVATLTSNVSTTVGFISTDRPKWLRVYNDGTSWHYLASKNGADWEELYSENLTNYLGVSIAGVGIAGESTGTSRVGGYVSIWSWELKNGVGTDSSW